MSAPNFQFRDIDRFVIGTVGMPGERTFYFQVVHQRQVLSFRCEKGQVAAFADGLDRMMKDLPAALFSPTPLSGLDLPLMEEFSITVMGLAYDADNDRIVIVFEEFDASSHGGDPGKAQFSLSRAQAAAAVLQGRGLVAAGRPLCPFCGASIDADGFNCNCYN